MKDWIPLINNLVWPIIMGITRNNILFMKKIR